MPESKFLKPPLQFHLTDSYNHWWQPEEVCAVYFEVIHFLRSRRLVKVDIPPLKIQNSLWASERSRKKGRAQRYALGKNETMLRIKARAASKCLPLDVYDITYALLQSATRLSHRSNAERMMCVFTEKDSRLSAEEVCSLSWRNPLSNQEVHFTMLRSFRPLRHIEQIVLWVYVIRRKICCVFRQSITLIDG